MSFLDRLLGRGAATEEDAIGDGPAKGLINQARDAVSTGHMEQAVALCEQALGLEPDNAAALQYRAVARASLGQVDAALADVTSAIHHAPRWAEPLLTRGALRDARGDHGGALEDLDLALKLAPDDPAVHAARGRSLLGSRQAAEALAELNEAVRLAPEDPRALTARGSAQVQLGQFDGAVADFTAAIAKAPSANLYRLRGDANARRNFLAEALDDFDEAVRREPEQAWGYYARSNLHHHCGRYADQRKDLAKALRFKPDDPAILNSLAWLLSTCPDDKVRDGARALELARKACALPGGGDFNGLDTLAAALAETGAFPEAIKEQEKVVAMAPAEVPAYRMRLDTYRIRQAWRDKPAKR